MLSLPQTTGTQRDRNSSFSSPGYRHRDERAILPLYYIIYFVIINWPLLVVQTFNIDTAMRVPFVLGAFFLLTHLGFCLQKKYAPFGIWAIWVVYTIANTMIIGLNYAANKHGLMDMLIRCTIPLSIFAMTLYLLKVNAKGTVRVIFWSLLFYCMELLFRGAFLSDFTLMKRMTNADGVNANELGLSFIVLAWATMVYERCVKPKNKLLVPLLLLFGTAIIVLRSASRSAFFVFVFLLAARYILFVNWRKLSTYLAALVVIPVVIIANSYISNKTMLGKRLEATSTEMRNYDFDDHQLAQTFGDRSVYYFEGWRIFKEHPWFGIGRDNYILHNSYGNFICHVEVMAQLAEGGIFGSLLFFLFYFFLYRKTARIIFTKNWNKADMVYLAGPFFIMIINLASYTAFRYIYFIPLATCLWYTTSDSLELQKLSERK